MNLLRKRETEKQEEKKVVKVDAEYYSDLQCKEYLLEAVATVVVDIGDEIRIAPKFEEEGYIGGF